MIGVAGHPVLAEVFSRPESLEEQFQSILEAAAFGTIGQPPIPTPLHRGRRFLELPSTMMQRPIEQAGLGRRLRGGNAKVEVESLDWMDHEIYALLSNPPYALHQPVG